MKLQKDSSTSENKINLTVKKHMLYSNKDYEEMTMRHLPPDHWKESLKKIKEISDKASQ